MKHRHRGAGIERYRWEWRTGISVDAGAAQESIQRLRLLICLDPGADIKRLAVYDITLENGLVGYQNIRAAIRKYAPNLSERQHRIQRNRDATSPDDCQEPVKAPPVIGAINRDLLAGLERNGTPEKGIDGADLGVHLGEGMKSFVLDGDFAISVSPQQLVYQIRHRDPAVARNLNAAENVHQAETGLRPQSLATQ
jgi:hypothetical protein